MQQLAAGRRGHCFLDRRSRTSKAPIQEPTRSPVLPREAPSRDTAASPPLTSRTFLGRLRTRGLKDPVQPRRRRLRPLGLPKRWLVVVVPVAVVVGLVAIAPPLPEPQSARRALIPSNGPFQYQSDAQVFSLDFDPRQVAFDLYEGWDREQEAYADQSALAFISGPMYERHGAEGSAEQTVPLGDLKLGDRLWRGLNRTAARQRAFLGIRHNGQVDFGYGELTPERVDRYDTFIGGLHSVYNDLEEPPDTYKGAYSISMGQQIRYYLPRIRVVYGLRSDGRLEVLMSRDGLTLEQTRALARERGLKAAYLPDHASKSRFIIPGVKGFSQEDANWISGGATSFVHVPYMLRLRQRDFPLQGSLLASLTPRLGDRPCGSPLQCGHSLGSQLLDRTLAGFNRLMEQGVEPLARLLWAPRFPKPANRPHQSAPFREPVITADPQQVRVRQERDLNQPAAVDHAGPAAPGPREASGSAPAPSGAAQSGTPEDAAPSTTPPGAEPAAPSQPAAAPAAAPVPPSGGEPPRERPAPPPAQSAPAAAPPAPAPVRESAPVAPPPPVTAPPPVGAPPPLPALP